MLAGTDFGWLIKKELEGHAGQVEYYSPPCLDEEYISHCG